MKGLAIDDGNESEDGRLTGPEEKKQMSVMVEKVQKTLTAGTRSLKLLVFSYLLLCARTKLRVPKVPTTHRENEQVCRKS